MFRENEEGKNWTGNDRFEGYCVDLTKRIAEVLNFSYELKLVKDNKFGSRGLIFNFLYSHFIILFKMIITFQFIIK